jgi:hypothetical protein
MHLSIYNRALLLATAVAFAGVAACSRSDRADAGRDTTQVGETGVAVTPSDTQGTTATQPARADTASAPASDTATTSETATETPKATPSPRAEAQDSSVANGDQGVSGYRAMEHDTATVALGDSGAVDKPGERLEPTEASQQANADTMASDSGRIRPPEDSSETTDSMPADHAMSDTAAAQEVSTDTTDADYAPMARDTSVTLAQGDTTGVAEADISVQTEADTSAISVEVDTTTANETEADTVSTATEPIRPPEDSTEVYGQVTDSTVGAAPEDSTEMLGNAPPDSVEADADANLATVGDANADAVGAAQIQPTGNTVTGAEAVALMSRQGQRCVIVDSEESRDAQWDMASSPATLNPCGTGTMTLQRIWTGEK